MSSPSETPQATVAVGCLERVHGVPSTTEGGRGIRGRGRPRETVAWGVGSETTSVAWGWSWWAMEGLVDEV